MAANKRPLSPHLQIYKPQLTSILSISHRITGVALAAGTLMLSCWVIAAGAGPAGFEGVQHFLGSPIGYFILFGWSACLFYHLSNGIRHLFWDAGYGFELSATYRSGYLVLAAAGGLTVLAWIAGLIFLGGR